MELLVPNTFYHIYNRGNNKEKIFYKDSNYLFFLSNIDKYLSGYSNLFAYCLIPNHFHMIIKTLSEDEVNTKAKVSDESNTLEYGTIIGEQFRKLFMSYTKAINKQENREGSLFKKLYQRKPITSEEYLIRSVIYVHLNTVHHKITRDFENYKWSSFNKILNKMKSNLQKEEILEMFGGKENYISIHREEREFMITRENE
jgi:putative transposase